MRKVLLDWRRVFWRHDEEADFTNEDITRLLHLPKEMEVMQGLEIVHVGRCLVPKWIFEFQNLMELELYGNNISSVDDYTGLARIPHLRKLVLAKNNKCIEFPKEFGKPMAFPKWNGWR